MATQVRFAIPEREIEQTGITFKRKVDTGMHGELTDRQNHIEWMPKGNEFIFQVKWEKFAEFAEGHGRRIRPKFTTVKSRKRLKTPAV